MVTDATLPVLTRRGDDGGDLELRELEKQLRRGADAKIDAKLQAGAMGKIETSSKSKYALRKGPSGMRGLDWSIADVVTAANQKKQLEVLDLIHDAQDEIFPPRLTIRAPASAPAPDADVRR